jgi:uncharacterized membrane protein
MVYQILVVVHVLAAMIWLGGSVAFVAVIVPASKKFSTETRRKMVRLAGEKFRTVGWLAIATLYVTGIAMLVSWGVTWDQIFSGGFLEIPRYRLVAEKFSLVVLMTFVSFLHDWVYGPRAARMSPGGAAEERERKRARMLAMATLILTTVIVIWAIRIARPWWLG